MTDGSQIITDSSRIQLLDGDLSYKIIGCLIDVSQKYGHLHKERVYQKACEEIFKKSDIAFIAQPQIKIYSIDSGALLSTYQPDFLIDGKIIIEIKATPFIHYSAINQLEQYLKASDKEIGLLVNFGTPRATIIRRIYTNDRKSWISNKNP